MFRSRKYEELENKIKQLEDLIIEKSTINDTLAGIIGSNWVELDTTKIKNSYNNNYVINRSITLLAQSIAQLPLRMYKGDTLITDPVKGFDVSNPAPDMSMYELLYEALVYYFYRGEFMLFINLDNPSIILEVVNPKLMTRRKEGGWKWNNKIIIPDEQLIYCKFLNPDGDRGLSPVDVVREELINDKSARDYNTKFFENYGKIGGVLIDEKGMIQSDAMSKLVNDFNKFHQGKSNAYKILGLPAGIKYQELTQTMREMEYLESRRDIRDRILALLGIHKSVFGVTDQVDRAVADTAM